MAIEFLCVNIAMNATHSGNQKQTKRAKQKCKCLNIHLFKGII